MVMSFMVYFCVRCKEFPDWKSARGKKKSYNVITYCVIKQERLSKNTMLFQNAALERISVLYTF